MKAENFINSKLGDKNYTHSEFPISRATLEEWLIEFAEQQLKNCNLQNVSFSLLNEGEIQKLYKDEMKKWKGTSWHTELEYHGELFIDGAKAVVAYLKGNES